MSMAKKREHDLVWLSSKCQEKGCLHKYRNIVDLEVQRDVIPTSEAMGITHAKRTINNTVYSKVLIYTNKQNVFGLTVKYYLSFLT